MKKKLRQEQRPSWSRIFTGNEIKTEIHYPVAPHKQKALQGIIAGDYKISQEIHETTLSLPISYFHNEKDIAKVVEVLNKF